MLYIKQVYSMFNNEYDEFIFAAIVVMGVTY